MKNLAKYNKAIVAVVAVILTGLNVVYGTNDTVQIVIALASAERKKYVANKAKAAADALAKAKADAAAKAKAEQAKLDAAKKADAEAAAKAAEQLKDMPNLVAENNNLLKQLVELVQQILSKLTGIFR